MILKDLLQEKGSALFGIKPEESVERAVEIMNDRHIGALLVLNEGGELVGIISERDVLRRLKGRCEDRLVREIMTNRDKIVIAHEEDDVEYAMEMFTKNRIRHLPVFAGNKLVGVVSIGDVVRALLADSRFQRKMMMDYITGGV